MRRMWEVLSHFLTRYGQYGAGMASVRGSYGNSSAFKSGISDGDADATTEKATASPNGQGYKAASSHSYSSTNYGSWSSSCSHIFGQGDI